MNRVEIVKEIKTKAPVGIELGVARGSYSRSVTDAKYFRKFYCIDKWDDHHNIEQYYDVIRLFRKKPDIIVIRATFKEALILFPDNFFDFIYIDGYAGGGQEGGKTLYEWYPKLKTGGVFAGHDYSKRWVLTKQTVDDFVAEKNLKLNVTDAIEDRYPSWWLIKE